MKRYIPLFAILALLTGLAAYFGPGLQQSWLFRRDCRAFIAAINAGNLQQVVSTLEASQRTDNGDLLLRYIPPDYKDSLESVKLTSYEMPEARRMWSLLTVKVQQGDGIGIYQARLYWVFDGGKWNWDMNASYGAPFNPGGEPEWVKLSDLVSLARQL